MATTKAQAQSAHHQTRVVRAYLESLNAPRPQGKRTREWLTEQANLLPERIHEETDPLQRLVLQQKLIDAVQDLEALDANTEDIEADFIKVALPFAERRGVTYAAFRAEGVPARVLREAGVS